MAIPSKGAIITGTTANNTTALPVGTDGQVLTANSACSQGLEWASIGGGWTCAPELFIKDCANPTSDFLLNASTDPYLATNQGALDSNCVIWRQTGYKTYQVYWILNKNVAMSNADPGVGQYYYCLPAALPNIDTSQPNQGTFTGCTACSGASLTDSAYNEFISPGVALGGSFVRFGGGNNRSKVDAVVRNTRSVRFLLGEAGDGTNNAGFHGCGYVCFSGNASSWWQLGIEYISV